MPYESRIAAETKPSFNRWANASADTPSPTNLRSVPGLGSNEERLKPQMPYLFWQRSLPAWGLLGNQEGAAVSSTSRPV